MRYTHYIPETHVQEDGYYFIYPKHQKQISCTFDRVVLTGTLPDICYDKAMISYLYNHHIKIFDYPKWAENLKNELKNHIDALAQSSGVSVVYIRKQKSFRKEEQIKEIITQRGDLNLWHSPLSRPILHKIKI